MICECAWIGQHWIVSSVAALGMLVLAVRILAPRRRKTVADNVVLMYSFPRATFAPSASPFVLKLETYLRMAKIPYEIDDSVIFGKKGKIPWITLNNEDVADSYFSIEHINKHFEVDLDEVLTTEQRATARMIEKTMEENTFWATMVQDRLFEHFDASMKLQKVSMFFKLFFKYYFVPIIKKYRWGHGIGRHSFEEIRHIGACDLRAMSVLLGNKQYFMGNEPTRVDASMFGILSLLIFGMPAEASSHKLLNSELHNLVDYVHRMKEKFWPDWDNVLLNSNKKND